MAAHSTLPNPIKPFILRYSVIAVALLSSAPDKACLSVCSVTLLASPKLEARALIEEWLKNIIRFDRIVLYVIDHQLLRLEYR